MNFLRVLLFLPSITLGLLGSAEVLPLVSFYALINYRYISGSIFTFILCFLPWIFYGLLLDNVTYFDLARSSVSMINVLVLFFLVPNLPMSEIEKLKKAGLFALLASVLVGVIQYFNFLPIDSLIRFLIPRSVIGVNEAIGLGARGISGLATEPGRQGMEIVFIAAFLIYFWLKDLKGSNNNKIKAFSLLALIGIYLFFMNKSATGIVFYSILIFSALLVFLYRSKNKIRNIVIMPILVIAILFIGMQNLSQERIDRIKESNRILTLAFIFAESNPSQFLNLITDYGGFRLSSILVHYRSPSLLGHGVGNSHNITGALIKEDDWLYGSRFYRTPQFSDLYVRPNSLLASYIAEIGLIGTLLVLMFIFFNLSAKSIQINISKIIHSTPMIFGLVAVGASGHPGAGIALLLILRE